MKWGRENGNKIQSETWLQIRPGTWVSLRFGSEKYAPPIKYNLSTLPLKIGLVYIQGTTASVTICIKNLSSSSQKNLGWRRCRTTPIQIRENLIRSLRLLYTPVMILEDSDDIIKGKQFQSLTSFRLINFFLICNWNFSYVNLSVISSQFITMSIWEDFGSVFSTCPCNTPSLGRVTSACPQEWIPYFALHVCTPLAFYN